MPKYFPDEMSSRQ